MNLSRTSAIVLRYFYLLKGSPARVVPLFAWVAVDIVLWGFLTRYLNTVAANGVDFVPVLLGAVLLWNFFIRVMQGVTMVFFEDVWSRNFLNYFATPLGIGEYLGGLVASSLVTSSAGLAMMLLVATAVFGLSYLACGVWLALFVMVLFVFGISLGIFACAIVLRMGPAAEWFVWPLPAILSPFAGVFYPVSVLPGWMQLVSRLLPPSHVFEGMRSILAGDGIQVAMLAWGFGLASAYLALSCLFFVRTYRHAVRTGLIARYSAETLS